MADETRTIPLQTISKYQSALGIR